MDKLNSDELLKLGLNHIENKELDEAVLALEKSLALDPGQALKVYLTLGNLYLEKESFGKAERVFEKIKVKYSDRLAGYLGLAKVFYKKKDWSSSKKYWEVCFEKFSENISLNWYIQYGEILLQLNKYHDAAYIYDKCKQNFPDKIVGYIGKAKSTFFNQDWGSAIEDWQLCIDKFPNKKEQHWVDKKNYAILKLGDQIDRGKTIWEKIDPDFKSIYTKIQLDKSNFNKEPNLKFDHILIITYGRSGSTLLQGLLNSIEGVVIRGENENVFWDLFKTLKKLRKNQDTYKHSILPNTPWYGACFYDESNLIKGYQLLARKILLDDQFGEDKKFVLGFKEIRYHEIGDEFESYLDFLQNIFPNTAMIFNTRNLSEVVNSAWWKDIEPTQALAELTDLEKKFISYSKEKSNCFSIKYEDLINKNDKLRSMYKFLGAEYNEDLINRILETPHSYKPEQEKIQKLFKDH